MQLNSVKKFSPYLSTVLISISSQVTRSIQLAPTGIWLVRKETNHGLMKVLRSVNWGWVVLFFGAMQLLPERQNVGYIINDCMILNPVKSGTHPGAHLLNLDRSLYILLHIVKCGKRSDHWATQEDSFPMIFLTTSFAWVAHTSLRPKMGENWFGQIFLFKCIPYLTEEPLSALEAPNF